MFLRASSAVLLVIFTLWSGLAAGAVDPHHRVYPVRVDVDAQGVATGAEPVGNVIAALHAPLRAAVLASEFEPATKNGAAVRSRTTVLVTVAFEKAGGGLAAKVIRVAGGTMPIAPPRYPTDALRRGVSARVWLRIAFAADGSRDDARTGVQRVEGPLRRTRAGITEVLYEKAFREAALSSLADWTHAPEEVDGQPVEVDVLLPITFCTRDCDLPAIEAPAPVAASDPAIRLAALRATAPGGGS